MTTILITDHGFPNLDRERAVIEAAGFRLVEAQCKTADEVVSAARACGAAGLLVQWAPVTAAVFAALPDLRVAVRYGIGVDNLDYRAPAARNVACCNVPDYCIDEVADHTLALALALARQLPQTHARTQAGTWKIVPPGPVPAFGATTFATAGFGRIARAVHMRAKAFGFARAAYDPYVPDEVFRAAEVRRLTKEQLFAEAGILSMHLPLTDDTRHFVNAATLAQIRPEAVLVNTSRGGLIDTAALADHLQAGRLAGAGLDVFEQEPLPVDHPLRFAPNTILTSHTAWFSQASVPRLQRMAAEEAVRVLRGEKPANRLVP